MGSNHGTGKLDILNNPKIELFIGVVCITGFEIMVSIDIQVKYSSIIHIIYQNEEVFSNVLKNICKYNSEGFIITIIHADNEFKPLIDKVKVALDVTTN